jgi:hypothetical protein
MTGPTLQVSLLSQITRVYHLAPVICPSFLGGLLRQPGFRVNAKLLDGTAIDKGLDSFHENLAAKSHHGNSAGERCSTSCSVRKFCIGQWASAQPAPHRFNAIIFLSREPSLIVVWADHRVRFQGNGGRSARALRRSSILT